MQCAAFSILNAQQLGIVAISCLRYIISYILFYRSIGHLPER